ncbi:MAG: exo-alpha-sialidase [Planctomycetia bacterium]|nr:exo-alpha-sialidase [Planctomycetia bacterium]
MIMALAASWRPAPADPRFQIASFPAATPPSASSFTSHVVERPPGVGEVHGSSLVVLPNNERLMVFFGGTHETALDVRLYQSRFQRGQWQPATPLISPAEAGQAACRYTRRVGNSSMIRDDAGRLHLFFVSVGYFGWSCSSLNQMTSTDDGKSWSPPLRLLTTPFFNVSTLVRSPAVPLQDGGFLLPAYIEITNKFPEVLQFDAHGKFVRKVRMSDQHGSLQACLLPINGQQAYAYERNRFYRSTPRLKVQETHDGGRTWSAVSTIEVHNEDSPVAVVQVEPDLYLMAYNPTHDREKLELAYSRNGIDWKTFKTLEYMPLTTRQKVIEFSYPTMLRQGDSIDLVYTWHRQGIKHCRFNVTWLKEQIHD